MKNKSADGLRGIAALNVAMTHFVAAFLPAMLHKNYPSAFPANPAPGTAFDVLTSPLASIFYNGHFAVLIFFALSGYVLTMPYFTTDPQAQVLQKRMWGRYLRLNIPIAAAVVLAYAIYHAGFIANQKVAPLSGSTVWLSFFYKGDITLLTMVREALYDSLILGNATLVPPLWTLKVEFIGSLYVLGFYLIKPKHRTLVPMALAFLLLYVLHGKESIYYYVIFLGANLNTIRLDKAARLGLCVVGLYFGCFQFETAVYAFLPELKIHGVELWDIKNFYNGIGALCLAAAVVHEFGKGLFEHRVVQFLGRISFSLYLLHFLILCSFGMQFYLHFPKTGWYLAANFASYISICFLAASLFEIYVDRNAIKVAHRFSTKLFSRNLDLDKEYEVEKERQIQD
jgi:peptidoglycan/LPS O-acetylase OafA/YrhL